jgi:hypothetical protein
MVDRLRAKMSLIGVAALLAALFGITAIGPGLSAAAKPATRTCSAAGLRYVKKEDGTTFSVAVANLKAKVATCATARSLAGTVAKDLLDETKVPARIEGFKVTVKEPCAGCTPNTQVTAKAGEELVTFTVKGGA